MAEFVNVDQKNIDEQIKKINGFNRQNLKIHVILDYTEFSGEDTNDSFLTKVFEKYKSSKEHMYNLSLNEKDQPLMLFERNLTKEELETVLNKIKDMHSGGSRKTKRSLPKHKKQKTEKKKG